MGLELSVSKPGDLLWCYWFLCWAEKGLLGVPGEQPAGEKSAADLTGVGEVRWNKVPLLETSPAWLSSVPRAAWRWMRLRITSELQAEGKDRN